MRGIVIAKNQVAILVLIVKFVSDPVIVPLSNRLQLLGNTEVRTIVNPQLTSEFNADSYNVNLE